MAMAVEDVGAAAAVAAEAGIENQIRENQGTTSRSAPSVNWPTRPLTRTGLTVDRVRSSDPGDCVGKADHSRRRNADIYRQWMRAGK